MKTKKAGKDKRKEAYCLIANVILSTIAFSFLIGLSAGVVQALEPVYWLQNGKVYEGLQVPQGQGIENSYSSIWQLLKENPSLTPDALSGLESATIPASPSLAPEATGTTTLFPAEYWVQEGVYSDSFVYGPTTTPADLPLPKPAVPETPAAGTGGGAKLPTGTGGGAEKALLEGLNPAFKAGDVVQFGNYAGKLGVENGQAFLTTNDGAKVLIPKDQLGKVSKAGGASGPADIMSTLQANTLLSSLFWGLTIGGLAYMVGGMFGMTSNNQKALFMGTFAGTMTYQLVQPLLAGKGWNMEMFGLDKAMWSNVDAAGNAVPRFGLTPAGATGVSFILAIGVGLMVFNMMYKKESTKKVTFQCNPFEPPTGGKYCELCNKDPMRPCSEYRCKSLGQACQLLNSGTGKEACAWVNPNDVTSPTIEPWADVLTKGHKYTDVKTRPPGTGMRVIRSEATDGCIKAFTPLTFGISTNEPTQCKIDYNHTTNVRNVKNAYDSMTYYFGESNLYDYNHSQTLRLPGPTALNQNISPELQNDGTFTLYTRCQDANGNVNEDEFAIRFCVDKGPDTTPPKIEGTSIPSGMPVSYGVNDTEIEVYVNEPADCKWSREIKDYDLMETDMNCDQNVWDINSNMLYKCYTTLTGLENRKENTFYFRCRDQPYLKGTDKENDRMTNSESYPYIIKGTQPLNIVKSEPNGTVKGYANVVPVDLKVETANGFNKGDAICYYSQQDTDESYIKMFETGTNKHRQRQDLTPGTYTFYIKCVDLGGNADYNKTAFTIEVDRSAPVITRVYSEGSNLKIETDEKSTCSYSVINNQKCNFALNEGKEFLYANSTIHYAEWKSQQIYYIKCRDSSGNEPLPTQCSIIVRAYSQQVK